MMYKLVDLQSLAVYCDTNVTMLADLPLQALAVRPCFSLSSLQWPLPLLYSLSVCLLFLSIFSLCLRLSVSLSVSLCLSFSLCLCLSSSFVHMFLFNSKNVLCHTFVQGSFSFFPFCLFFSFFLSVNFFHLLSLST